jgi:hypothetical protein
MAKGFSKNNPLDKLSGTSVPKSTEVQKEPPAAVEPKQTEPEQKQEKPQTTQKRKVGRPKTKDIKNTCKNINVAVPITLLDKWEDIKIVHGSNLTEYITKLIEKDMNTNYEHYKDIADSLKNI